MRRLLLLLITLLTLGAPALADTPEPISVNSLIENAKQYDGKMVTIEGEVVGDVMIRGSHGWVNISDATGDIGVWAPADLLERIRYVGRYHTKGDKVRVVGEFRRADPEHGGDLDVRATDLVILQPGGPVGHPAPTDRIPLALLSLLLAGITGGWLYLRTFRKA